MMTIFFFFLLFLSSALKKNNIDRVLEAGEEEDGGHTHIEHGTIDDYQN